MQGRAWGRAGAGRRRSGRRVPWLTLLLAASASTGCSRAVGAAAAIAPSDSGYLAPARLASLPAPERARWEAYVARSRDLQRRDRALLEAELQALGRDRITPAPDVRTSLTLRPHMTAEWFRGDSARALAEAILSYQTPSGGWSKHVDFSRGRRPPGTSFFSESASWSFIATFDNNATTDQMRFLARSYAATGDERHRAALERALGYVLDAQYPNGCWPQVYPLMGGYHDAATFNDDATINVMKVVRDVSRGADGLTVFSAAQRARATEAFRSGLDCLLATQVVAGGRRTIWGQQHDPLTLVPVKARSYEPASLASRESAGITRFLMDVSRPEPRVVEAVHAAADWFASHKLYGITYDPQQGIVESPGAGPVWPRMSELSTGRPIFSNRDGVVLYDWRKLTDRARGYAWFVPDGTDVLREYEEWARRYPRIR